MTIDITIGKLKIKSLDEVFNDKMYNEWTYTHEQVFTITDFLGVKQCPDEEDGCTKEDTMCPNSAYRSGSISGMHNFFQTVMPALIMRIRPISTNDHQITRIKPFLEEINKLKYKGDIEQHKKRLHWFKFWCNKAVELYGDDAVILFS